MGHHTQKRFREFCARFEGRGIARIRSQPRRKHRRCGRERKTVPPWECLAHGLMTQHTSSHNILACARQHRRSQQDGKPRAEFRKTLGYIVLAFLALLFVVAYALKKEYWKDIH